MVQTIITIILVRSGKRQKSCPKKKTQLELVIDRSKPVGRSADWWEMQQKTPGNGRTNPNCYYAIIVVVDEQEHFRLFEIPHHTMTGDDHRARMRAKIGCFLVDFKISRSNAQTTHRNKNVESNSFVKRIRCQLSSFFGECSPPSAICSTN